MYTDTRTAAQAHPAAEGESMRPLQYHLSITEPTMSLTERRRGAMASIRLFIIPCLALLLWFAACTPPIRPTDSTDRSAAGDGELAVAIGGMRTRLASGTAMILSAGVRGYAGTLEYAWYLNGAAQEGKTSCTIGSDLEPGDYRVEVVARTADGRRTGSAIGTFTVVRSTPITMEWNPNNDGMTVGYRLYYGEASHAYSAVVDTGDTTATISVIPGVTYYFVLTAYAVSGCESSYSEELSYTLPLS